MSEEHVGEVVKWYTLARRFPQVIGRTSDGARIPGGPYTYTQVFVGVGLLVAGLKTTALWAHFGTMYNGMLLLMVTAAVVVILGRLPLASRNPWAMAQGAYRAVSASRSGTIGGRPVSLPRPGRTAARVAVQHLPETSTVVAEEADTALADPAPTDPVPVDPAPTHRGAPVESLLSTTQRLLAAAGG